MTIIAIPVMVIGWLIAETFNDEFLQYLGTWMFFAGFVTTLVWLVK